MPVSVSIARGHLEEASLALSEPKVEGTWVSSRPNAAAHLFLSRDEPTERAWQMPLPQNSPTTRLDSPTPPQPPERPCIHSFFTHACLHAYTHAFIHSTPQKSRVPGEEARPSLAGHQTPQGLAEKEALSSGNGGHLMPLGAKRCQGPDLAVNKCREDEGVAR